MSRLLILIVTASSFYTPNKAISRVVSKMDYAQVQGGPPASNPPPPYPSENELIREGKLKILHCSGTAKVLQTVGGSHFSSETTVDEIFKVDFYVQSVVSKDGTEFDDTKIDDYTVTFKWSGPNKKRVGGTISRIDGAWHETAAQPGLDAVWPDVTITTGHCEDVTNKRAF